MAPVSGNAPEYVSLTARCFTCQPNGNKSARLHVRDPFSGLTQRHCEEMSMHLSDQRVCQSPLFNVMWRFIAPSDLSAFQLTRHSTNRTPKSLEPRVGFAPTSAAYKTAASLSMLTRQIVWAC